MASFGEPQEQLNRIPCTTLCLPLLGEGEPSARRGGGGAKRRRGVSGDGEQIEISGFAWASPSGSTGHLPRKGGGKPRTSDHKSQQLLLRLSFDDDIRAWRESLSKPSEAAAMRAAVHAGLHETLDAVSIAVREIADATTVSCGDPVCLARPSWQAVLDKLPGARQAAQRSIELLGVRALDAIARGDFAAGTAFAAERRRIAGRVADLDRNGPANR